MGEKELLRIAIVVCGGATLWHISSMRKIKNVELVAVCDKSEDLVRRVAGRKRLNMGQRGRARCGIS